MAQQIQLRNGSAAAWTTANPTLAAGEVGCETDTKKLKIGDGATAWNGLAYASGGTGSTRTFRGVVATQAAMLALAIVNVGDWVSRTDLSGQQFELTTVGQATLANWTAVASGVPNQTGALAASATAAPVADTVIAALATKATAGLVTTVTLTTHTLVAADIGTLQQQQGVSALTLSIDTAANSGITWVAGKVFAVGSVNTGAVALAALAGVTIVNIGAKAVVQDDTPLVVQMSPTVNRWLVL